VTDAARDSEAKERFHTYLQEARDAMAWKLEGLSEYDVRRPVTPTGTNLLGLVKHLTIVEAWYFGRAFDRPFAEPLDWWDDDAEPDVDAWVTPDETRSETARRAGHADIVREQIDGAAGMRAEASNVPDRDEQAWAHHRATVEAAARAAGDPDPVRPRGTAGPAAG
jgi:hypothetical protein